MTEEYGKYSKGIYHCPAADVPSARIWSPPSRASFKINVDASLEVEGWVRLGVIARDHLGEVQLVLQLCVEFVFIGLQK